MDPLGPRLTRHYLFESLPRPYLSQSPLVSESRSVVDLESARIWRNKTGLLPQNIIIPSYFNGSGDLSVKPSCGYKRCSEIGWTMAQRWFVVHWCQRLSKNSYYFSRGSNPWIFNPCSYVSPSYYHFVFTHARISRTFYPGKLTHFFPPPSLPPSRPRNRRKGRYEKWNSASGAARNVFQGND